MTDPLQTARRVLATERDALDALAASLDDTFAEVVDALLALDGRIVLSGVGKSGHVARKIAATLASTGAPALFIHPTEASHGDMGMITASDAVIALSRSGETAELADVTAYCRRHRIPLVAITARGNSALARAANHVLLLPDAPEACATTRAPTTSTTLQMALGDALAVALLEARGFSARDFRDRHPGGTLGAQLLTMGELAHRDMPLVKAGTALDEAIGVMSAHGFGCVGVVEAGRLAGIVTDGDLRRAMGRVGEGAEVDALMTRAPVVAAPGELAAGALARMSGDSPKIMQVFVVEGGVPVGIVHLHDLLRAGVA